jgi:hypothetical protein
MAGFASAILTTGFSTNKSRRRDAKCTIDTRWPGSDAGRRGHVVGNNRDDWVMERRSDRKREYENKVVCSVDISALNFSLYALVL